MAHWRMNDYFITLGSANYYFFCTFEVYRDLCFNITNFSNELLTIDDKNDFKSSLDEYLNLCLEHSPTHRSGWIASLDHGVQKITPEANIHLFIDQIRTKLA